MSDFDREAERKKLREKYERDKAKREASERMSELLLKGATMTNRHCPACHSPVFRYDGQQFCPTCETEITEAGELADRDGDGQTVENAAEPATETDADGSEEGPDDAETVEAESDDTVAIEAESNDDETPPTPDESVGSPPTPAPERRPSRIDPPARRDADTVGARAGDDRGRLGGGGEDDGDLENAVVRLRTEIDALTRRAAETSDVGRKRDLLAAAREAAETLETVRRL